MKGSIFFRLLVLVVLVSLVGASALANTNSDLVISEVAWSGTQASWADEWVELKNASDETIDLTGWTLSWDSVSIHLGKEKENTLTVNKKTLKPGSVLLLERSDDDAVSSVRADIIYKGSLSNSGEKMVLKTPRGDKVNVVNGSEGWMAGTSSSGDPAYASMELIDGQWKTHKSKGNQKDAAEENQIYGSPGRLPEATG